MGFQERRVLYLGASTKGVFPWQQGRWRVGTVMAWMVVTS